MLVTCSLLRPSDTTLSKPMRCIREPRTVACYTQSSISDKFAHVCALSGIAVQWAPTPRVVNSFLAVFPHVVQLPDLANSAGQ